MSLIPGGLLIPAAALVVLGALRGGFVAVVAITAGAAIGLIAVLILARLAYFDRRATKIRRRWSSPSRGS